MTKISTYLGFCIRAGKIAFGINRIEAQKRAYLLIADGNLGKNSLKVMVKEKDRLNCSFIVTENGLLGELAHRPTVKAVAILDENLAMAIVNEAKQKPQFKFYSGGEN